MIEPLFILLIVFGRVARVDGGQDTFRKTEKKTRLIW